MKIQDIKSFSGFIHAERYVNNPKYSSTAQYSEIENIYHPRHGIGDFDLPFYLLDENGVEVVVSNPADVAMKVMRPESGKIRFFMHPAMREELRGIFVNKSGGVLKCAPSSSTRTLILLDGSELMIKTHLNKRISRFIRRLKGNSVKHSLAISAELDKIATDLKVPKSFGFLAESIGVIVSEGEDDFGYIIREKISRPFLGKMTNLIPFFALYSRDTKALEDEPILIQLARANQKDPFKFLLEDIVYPMIEGWVFAYLNYGLLLESHAQNTLLEIDDDFRPGRIIHRDFQSIAVDPKIRAAKNLPLPFKKHIIGQDDYPDLFEQSLIYDHFIGDYLFGTLEEFVTQYFGKSAIEFRENVKQIFRGFLPNQNDYFPKGHVVLAEGLAMDNKYGLIHINEQPLYR